jgi:hypothetical protein
VSEENIYQAINAIMAEVGYVQKVKTGGLSYSFAGEADLIAAIRPVMVEHGVFMYVANILDVRVEQYETAKGTAMTNTSLVAKIVFYHAPSGTSVTVTSRGEGADSGDKSSNKALTGAYKYALRQTFCIETGDDPDKTPSDDQERAGKKDGKAEPSRAGSDGRADVDHSQVAFVKYAKTLGIEVGEIVPILKAGGINEFDKEKWGEMVTLLVAVHEAKSKEAVVKF